MEEEYKKLVKKFYEIYIPLARKYNLRSHMHFSVDDDGIIEAWEYEGEIRGKCVCRVKEENDAECYKRATEELEYYKKEREDRADERKAVRAG